MNVKRPKHEIVGVVTNYINIRNFVKFVRIFLNVGKDYNWPVLCIFKMIHRPICVCFQFGDSQKLRLVRILRSTVMVRVGGGWMALDEFLVKNDPCRGKLQQIISWMPSLSCCTDVLQGEGFHSDESCRSGIQDADVIQISIHITWILIQNSYDL